MRRLHLIFALGCMVAAAVACAASEDEAAPPGPPDSGSDPAVVPPPAPDADVSDGAADAARDALAPLPCSDAGWCATSVPDPGIRFYALVPFEKTAVALAWLDGRTTPLFFDGIRWSALANDAWVVSPKNKQVLFALAAPSEHEIWVGGAGGYLARGSDASGTWSWTASPLGTSETVRSIYVASKDEMFVATDLHIYRKVAAPDAGDGAWVVDYEAPPVDVVYPPFWEGSPAKFHALLGTGTNEIWALGMRARCTHLAHRTRDGWTVLVDAIGRQIPGFESATSCSQRPGFPIVGYRLRSPISPKPGTLIGLHDNPDEPFENLVTVRLDEGGLLPIEFSLIPVGMKAIWQAPERAAFYMAGYGAIMTNAGTPDAGDWRFSTISFDGKTPTTKWFETMGGVSEKNMWVAGESHALRRTLP